jgi:hypothetical protein
MHNGRLIVRHVILSIVFLVLFLVLNRPELIFISRFGLSAWYPATGLVLALMVTTTATWERSHCRLEWLPFPSMVKLGKNC